MQHICMISHSDSPWAPLYAMYFKTRGYRVSMISFSPAKLDGIELHYLGAMDDQRLLPKWQYIKRISKLRRLLRELRPDVIMATYMRSNGLLGSLTKCAPLLISTVGTDQGFPLPYFGNMITRYMCRKADHIHAVSQELADKLTQVGVPPDKITILPVGIDSQMFHAPKSDREESPLRILCTRKHWPVYDNKTIVQAIAILKAERFDCQMTFAGDDPFLHTTREEVNRLNVQDIVHFTGQLTLPEVADNLRSHDIYLSASTTDGTSSSLMEAICTSITPVVSDIRANRPWIDHQQSGYLFKVGDAQGCAEGIRWAWENREAIVAKKEIARQRVLEEADFFRNSEKIEALLKKIAKK